MIRGDKSKIQQHTSQEQDLAVILVYAALRGGARFPRESIARMLGSTVVSARRFPLNRLSNRFKCILPILVHQLATRSYLTRVANNVGSRFECATALAAWNQIVDFSWRERYPLSVTIP